MEISEALKIATKQTADAIANSMETAAQGSERLDGKTALLLFAETIRKNFP